MSTDITTNEVLIDIATNEVLSESDVRERAAPVGLKSAEFWDNELLSNYGVTLIEYVRTPAPEVEKPYFVREIEPEKVGQTWTQAWEVVVPSLDDAKTFALNKLDSDFDASLPPVIYDGKPWKPGHSSAAVIRDAAEMAELHGAQTIELTDADYNQHTYTLADAKLVSAAIGIAYQSAFLQRNGKRKLIIDAESPVDALAVKWVS
ncbi:hypothetical protein [Gilvimarinus chinensis]|uniref:hypothetical protein n=1 Tax=Gilvimarinus chinensis TaxID=396005 RepID=UPI0003706343|nr:hypothetical protein [Gilvimarinus chinensis]